MSNLTGWINETLYPEDEREGDVMVKPQRLNVYEFEVKVIAGPDIHYFKFSNPNI